MSSSTKSRRTELSDQEIQQHLSQLQNEMQTLAGKVGELEVETDEHRLVLTTIGETLVKDPDRKCFRLVGGVLVELTVKDVAPALQMNLAGISKVVANLTEQYKKKGEELEAFKQEHGIRIG